MRNGLIAFRQIPATLIGPPSQYSHLRPIRYASEDATTPNQQHHPYEPTNQIDHFSSDELSFDLSRRKLDNFNDKFWSDNNIRCEHALKEFVGDAEGERRQVLLQQFWRDWVSRFAVFFLLLKSFHSHLPIMNAIITGPSTGGLHNSVYSTLHSNYPLNNP